MGHTRAAHKTVWALCPLVDKENASMGRLDTIEFPNYIVFPPESLQQRHGQSMLSVFMKKETVLKLLSVNACNMREILTWSWQDKLWQKTCFLLLEIEPYLRTREFSPSFLFPDSLCFFSIPLPPLSSSLRLFATSLFVSLTSLSLHSFPLTLPSLSQRLSPPLCFPYPSFLISLCFLFLSLTFSPSLSLSLPPRLSFSLFSLYLFLSGLFWCSPLFLHPTPHFLSLSLWDVLMLRGW